MKGILFNSDFDLTTVDGKLTMGETTMQEVGVILGMNQGELKADPILGPGLVRLIRSSTRKSEIQKIVRLHLLRDGKRYEEVEKFLQINTK